MIASDTVPSKHLFSYAEINVYLVSLSFFDTPLLRSVVSKKDSELRPAGQEQKRGRYVLFRSSAQCQKRQFKQKHFSLSDTNRPF